MGKKTKSAGSKKAGQTSAPSLSYREQLLDLYTKYDPQLIDTVDSTLKDWTGKEFELLNKLKQKYEGNTMLKEMEERNFNNVITSLKNIYKKSIRPLEEAYKFDQFATPFLEDVDFDAKPMVLLLGQYSVGKTTFIRHLIGRDFTGIRIGPEPTTDRFVAVMKGPEDKTIPGNALVCAADRPFRSLEKFGGAFLDKFECAECNTAHGAKILDSISFVDSPGVLSGEKQRIGRSYSYTSVIEWFASRCDRILLLFDAHKLDISDEFKRTMECLKGNDDKVRVVLNKADSVNPQQLMRVYGALMWALGKVVRTPEVMRVYIGSFWDKPLDESHDCFNLFQNEAADLIEDLNSLPRNSAIRKINELVKRARLARVHAYIISSLKSQLPSFMGIKKKQEKLLNDLANQFQKISKEHSLPQGDFPNATRFRSILVNQDLSKFPKLSDKMMKKLNAALATEVPQLMNLISATDQVKGTVATTEAKKNEEENPFFQAGGNWVVTPQQKQSYDEKFRSLNLNSAGLLAGDAAKQAFAESNLQHDVLFKVWSLADVSGTNSLNADEYALACHLINEVKFGKQLPAILPPNYVPPQMR